jgi:hypothetical protein
VFLSGDVHFAFTIEATFAEANRSLQMAQLTSSALKNTGKENKQYVGRIIEPVGNRLDTILGWKKAPTSRALERLYVELRNAFLSAEYRRYVEARITAVEATLQKRPVTMTDAQAKEFDIVEPADWVETFSYRRNSPLDELPIVGENNVGLVRFSGGLSRLEHTLIVSTEGRVKPIPVAVDLMPLPTAMPTLDTLGRP